MGLAVMESVRQFRERQSAVVFPDIAQDTGKIPHRLIVVELGRTGVGAQHTAKQEIDQADTAAVVVIVQRMALEHGALNKSLHQRQIIRPEQQIIGMAVALDHCPKEQRQSVIPVQETEKRGFKGTPAQHDAVYRGVVRNLNVMQGVRCDNAHFSSRQFPLFVLKIEDAAAVHHAVNLHVVVSVEMGTGVARVPNDKHVPEQGDDIVLVYPFGKACTGLDVKEAAVH